MKTNKNPLLSVAGIATLGLALLLSACSKTNDANSSAATTSSPNAISTAGTVDSWDSLKTYSYEQRSEFANRANEYAQNLDRRIQNATGEASTRLAEARDELRTAASEVSNATADTWEATKERVGRAWQKAESAAQNVAE